MGYFQVCCKLKLYVIFAHMKPTFRLFLAGGQVVRSAGEAATDLLCGRFEHACAGQVQHTAPETGKAPPETKLGFNDVRLF